MNCDRKKTITEYILGIILIAFLICMTCQASFASEDVNWNGTGTESDPYLIGGYTGLTELADAVKSGDDFSGKTFRLTADIDLGVDWEPIGTLKEGATSADKGVNILPFSGTLNGSGFTVTSAEGGKPLFGYVRGATICNLAIAGKNIDGNGLIRNYVSDLGAEGTVAVHTATVRNVTIKSGTSIKGAGIVSGYASAGNTVNISHCTVEAGVIIGCDKDREKIGSFGGDFNGSVTACSSAATVYGTNYVGGIIGCKGNSMSDVSVTGCTFSGEVIATGSYAGGIAGGGYGGTVWGINTAPNCRAINIQSCLSIGSVTAADAAGGILGYETTVQIWSEGYIRSNLFAGTVTTTEGSVRGAIVGMFRGMDKLSIVKDNYYSENCGADRGIGEVTYLDTSCETHETVYGKNYFDSSGEIPIFEGLNDTYKNNLKPNYNRTDDPLGADAYNLAKPVTSDELKDGTVTELLNNATGSSKNWTQGVSTPVIEQGVELVSISVADGYKAEYYMGETLDTENMEFILSWSDGTQTRIAGDDPALNISGFDSSSEAVVSLTASYKNVSTIFTVVVVKAPDETEEKETIYFTLLGDGYHGDVPDSEVHTRSRGNLTEWIAETALVVPHNSTAYQVVIKALGQAGLKFEGDSQNQYGTFYLKGIQIPGDERILYELDNGVNSGWMYAVNDEEPGVSMGEYNLEDGDEIVLFYTDDYKLEKSAVGGQDGVDRVRAEYVSELIEKLPEKSSATVKDRDDILYANMRYEALSESQLGYVTDELKEKIQSLMAVVDSLPEKSEEEEQAEAEAKARSEALDEANNLISEVEKIDKEKYTADSYTAVTDALTKLKEVIADDNSDSKAIRSAIDTVNDAVSKLVEEGSTEPDEEEKKREEAVAAANKAMAFVDTLNADDYTEDSFDSVIYIRGLLKDIIDNADSTSTEINSVIDSLNDAIANLKTKEQGAQEEAEKQEEEARAKARETAAELIEKVESLNSEDYTEETIASVVTAEIELARVLSDGNSTSTDISKANEALSSALDGLITKEQAARENAEKEALALIEEVSRLDESVYTSGSFARVLSSRTVLEQKLALPDSTSEDIYSAISVLQEAINDLLKKQTFSLKKKNKTYRYKTIKKAKKTYKALTIKNKTYGKVTYKIAGKKKAKKALKFNKKTGEITVRKGSKKGKYIIRITVTAAGSKEYEKKSRSAKITVKIR